VLFKADDKFRRTRFRLRRADGEIIRVAFSDCRVIRLSPDQGELTLFCPMFNVILSGRWLGSLADAIDRSACVWVHEFDAKHWDMPPVSVPLLRQVELITPHPPELKARFIPTLVKD
jgi:hypothetical protein